MGRVAGKVGLVTGAAQGLGEADARRLVEEGAQVVITDIDDDRGRAVAAEIGADYQHLDVSDADAWQMVMAEVLGRHGRLDILVNNAGIAIIKNIENTTVEEWRRTLAVHLDGAFFGCQQAVAAMRETGGSIVNISSITALQAPAEYLAYAAAKGGIRTLTKSVAAHCKAKGYPIRCNSIHPGLIHTAIVEAAVRHSAGVELANAEDPAAIRREMGIGMPVDVANLVLFLASDESRHINGAELVVDDGATAVLAP